MFEWNSEWERIAKGAEFAGCVHRFLGHGIKSASSAMAIVLSLRSSRNRQENQLQDRT